MGGKRSIWDLLRCRGNPLVALAAPASIMSSPEILTSAVDETSTQLSSKAFSRARTPTQDTFTRFPAVPKIYVLDISSLHTLPILCKKKNKILIRGGKRNKAKPDNAFQFTPARPMTRSANCGRRWDCRRHQQVSTEQTKSVNKIIDDIIWRSRVRFYTSNFNIVMVFCNRITEILRRIVFLINRKNYKQRRFWRWSTEKYN